jgi:hypothetical protein
MKTSTSWLLVILAAAPAVADYEEFTIAVSTDRRIYDLGEPVNITLTVSNSTAEPQIHSYGCSCCVHELWIEDSQGDVIATERQLACPMVTGQMEFDAFESKSKGAAPWWQNPGDFGYNDPPPHAENVPPGTYRVVVDWRRKGRFYSAPFVICDGECPEPRALVIPAAGNNQGMHGTSWSTDLEIRHLGGVDSLVKVSLLEHGSSNQPALSEEVEVGNLESLVVEDVLESLFDHDGQAALHLEIRGGDVHVSSRTFNTDDRGSFGQAVPALSVGESRSEILVPDLRHEDGVWRSNIGLVNFSARAIVVDIELVVSYHGFDASLEPLNLAPFEYRQLNDVFQGRFHPLLDIESACARIVASDQTWGLFVAYGSVIDNRTGDAVFVEGIPTTRERPQN